MRFFCSTDSTRGCPPGRTQILIYERTTSGISVGAGARELLLREGYNSPSRAWDFLSIALSVLSADLAIPRSSSPDGWTREFDLEIMVSDPAFWATESHDIVDALSFLTTDVWSINFIQGTFPQIPPTPKEMSNDCVMLLSGGLDSLVGAIDLVSNGRNPVAVSQVVRGDASSQRAFATAIGSMRHLQISHAAVVPTPTEPSQRSRSLVFLAFGVMAATSLRQYHQGTPVTLYVCENGFISINHPLTQLRVGSLSTRTTHPDFLRKVQHVFDAAGLTVLIENPYQLKTKGEMLVDCADQSMLDGLAKDSTSCSRYLRYKYTHCGRCLPCQVRRAAFLRWGRHDTTKYVYRNLGKRDPDNSGFDDVRSVSMALVELSLGGPLHGSLTLRYPPTFVGVVERGLAELSVLHMKLKIK